MKPQPNESRRSFIKDMITKAISAMILVITGCKPDEPALEGALPTATLIPPKQMVEVESETVREKPTDTPEPVEIKLDKIGKLVIVCGENLQLEGKQIPASIDLLEDWLNPIQYIKQDVILGEIIGEGLFSRDYEGRTVLDTNSLSGEETCVIGFEYGEQFLGINISFKDLIQDFPVKTRFNGIVEFFGKTFKFNTYFYIPQIDRGGSRGSGDGTTPGSTIGGNPGPGIGTVVGN